MKRIRINNDIEITWRIYRNGNAEDFADKAVAVKLLDSVGKVQPMDCDIVGNEVHILFEGRNQTRIGNYTLVLTENAGERGMVTIDETEAFSLVRHTSEEGGDDVVGIKTQYVEIVTNLEFGIGGGGTSDCGIEISEDGILTDKKTGKRYILTPYQEPQLPKYYIGQINATRTEFSEKTDEELLANSTSYAVTEDIEDYYIATENIIYLLIPDTLEIGEMSFTDDSFTTYIGSNDMWNVSHDDVELDGVMYKVYGYRMNGVSGEHPTKYVYTIKLK